MSDSDSDSSNEKIRRTKRKFVVKFQIEDTSSEDSDVAGPSSRIRRTTKKLDASSSDSDFVSKQKKRSGNTKKPINEPSTSATETKPSIDSANSSDSDTSCELSEKCPICLHSFREQEVGAPNVCEHSFCAPCIEEWSGNVQTCPIDRKPFTHIRIRSRYADGSFVREIAVSAKKTEPETSESDFTSCEICGRCDREDSMLLCDGCDAGYHMGCLDPPLTEIPEGSWYCDNCFDSDASDDVDITQLIAEMDDLPVPATRLRVRREDVPRITRTRQSERIRATILNRRHENRNDVATVLDLSMPGSSRSRQTVTTTTTTTMTTTTTKRQSGVKRKYKKRRRRVNRRRRTYVVEYDVDEFNNKFGIKTSKRVIRRRRKTKKSRKKCTQRSRGRNLPQAGDSVGGGSQERIRVQYPKLHLFGNKNALEYFSDEEENDEGIGSLSNSYETGDGLIVMGRSRSNGLRNLIRRKNVAINEPTEANTDILSNIMDTMNRWHSASQPSAIEKIKIKADGSLEFANRSERKDPDPNADIQNAPMYPRNGTSGNQHFNNSNGYRGGNSNRNSGNFTQYGSGNRNSGQTSFQSYRDNGGGGNQSGFGENFSHNPFQRQRGGNRAPRNRFQFSGGNQAAQPQQGLYDGEDIAPLQNEVPTESEENEVTTTEPLLKEVQQDDDLPDTAPEPQQDSPNAEPPDMENNESQPSNSNTEGSVEPATCGQSTKSNDYSESDEADEQDFEYSEESMQVAKDSKELTEEDGVKEPEQPNTSSVDNDEDLVQLDDDEHFANETVDEQLNAKEDEEAENEDDVDDDEEEEGDENEGEEEKVSDAELETLNPPSDGEKDQNENSTEEISEEEQRSYTPLNDRTNTNDDDERTPNDQPSTSSEKNEAVTTTTGIEGMDTEMISEDENENILDDDTTTKDLKADKENNNRKGEGDESFKKVSKNTKDRNYRDKKEKSDAKHRSRRSRSKSRSSISRSRSRNRSHRGDRRDRSGRRQKESKRQEIQRYDVRTVIADKQPRTYKDKYGRDTSRPPRVDTSRSRSPTPLRRVKSRSYSRSVSPAFSPRRRSPSRRSVSRGRRHSNSIRRNRRSISRTRRRRRSASRSPYRTFASSRSRSFSRGRVVNGQSRSRSRSFSPKPTHRYHLHDDHSRSRSRGRKSKKKITEKKNRLKKKPPTGSRRLSPFHSPNRTSRSRSWDERGSWNRSVSDLQQTEGDLPSWTPPIAHAPENLTVILKNKDGSKRKRDKKRKTEKRKAETVQKKDKRRRNDSPALPSKEVFASGDNILVSVSFNKDKPQQQQQQQTTIVTLPPTKEQILSKKQNEREQSRRSRRTNRDAPRKHRKVDIKPVAIIDLDNSPFKEVTPSPRAVIILSDSDHENDKSNKSQSLNYSMVSNVTDSIVNDDGDEQNIRVTSPPQSPATDSATFELPLGPKTPPEPSHLVKFSISTNSKTKIRTVVNPLHDDNDDDDDEDGNSENKESNGENANVGGEKAQNIQNQQKVGPNTPPGPCSPDVYDPFEPTKSPSQTPSDSMQATDDGAENFADDKAAKPVDVTMALLNSKASIDAAATLLSSTLGGDTAENDIPNDEPTVSPYKDKPNDEPATSKSGGVHVYSNILLTPAKERLQTQPTQSRSSTLTIQNLAASVSATVTSKQSPLKFVAGSIISKLPLPKIPKPTRHNGNDNDNMDIESPYSPGSSDYEDLFEPPQSSPIPQPSGSHLKKHRTNAKSNAAGTSANKPADIFDDLFGSSPVNKHSSKSAPKRRASKHSSSIKDWIAVTKHSTGGGYTKLNEEQLRILDDVPGSAVELQAKDKFLRKLNRQERVIEEVKLVLKPHYNKKHITKEEYKEIMRRAVPKICHNRTGEINPKKIKKLIEAYVAKFRQKRKLQQSTNLVIK